MAVNVESGLDLLGMTDTSFPNLRFKNLHSTMVGVEIVLHQNKSL